jgi:hypothetical protein
MIDRKLFDLMDERIHTQTLQSQLFDPLEENEIPKLAAGSET